MYKLKKGQEAFTIVEGPDAGKSFSSGKLYDEVPAAVARRFEEAKPAPRPGRRAMPAAPADAAPAPAKSEVSKDKEAAPPAAPKKREGGRS